MKKHSTLSYKRSNPNDSFIKTVSVLFILWMVYRTFFHLSPWIDEVLVKGVVFGLPVWFYCKSSLARAKRIGLDASLFLPGMLLGLAFGGLFGFTVILANVAKGMHLQSVNIFLSTPFLSTMFLSLFTSWWESLFFFGYVQNMLGEKFSSLGKFGTPLVILLTTVVYVLFHSPLRIVTLGFGASTFGILFMLFLFSAGQAIVYNRTKNMYALVLSYLLWGMVLLVYGV